MPAAAPQAVPVDVRELARRTVPRDSVEFRTVLAIETIGELDARIMDISPYGFQARARSRVLERGERVTITLPVAGEVAADVMWGLKGLFGCKFVEPVESGLYAEMLVTIRAAGSTPLPVAPID